MAFKEQTLLESMSRMEWGLANRNAGFHYDGRKFGTSLNSWKFKEIKWLASFKSLNYSDDRNFKSLQKQKKSPIEGAKADSKEGLVELADKIITHHANEKESLSSRAEEARAELAALQAAYGQERDLLNQLLGQAQAFQAAGQLLQTFGVSKLAYVKETKLYRQLAGTKTPNGLELKGTWEEFCGLLGISDEKANQDIANLQSFGEAALEQMQRMGIGYRELRQYRRLPEDQKRALIEVAKVVKVSGAP